MNYQELVAEVLEHVRGMWRFRWLSLALAWAVLVVGVFYVLTVPDEYRAETRVFVDTNSLLRPLMEGLTAEQNPMNEVQLVSTAVLTRPNLEAVAHETDLMLDARTPAEMEGIVTDLQRSVVVTGGRDNIFTIQFEHENRQKSVDVVQAIYNRFVEGTIGNEGEDAEISEQALASEIESHEIRLREAEAEMAAFKNANLGYMPGAAGDYYDRLQAALATVSQKESAIRLVTQRRNELQRQIEGEDPVFGIMPGGGFGGATACRYDAQIMQLEAELDQLAVQYTDKHPRIQQIRDRIAGLTERCAADLEAGLGVPVAPQFPLGESLETNPVYSNLRIQLSESEVRLVELQAELAAAQREVQQLRDDVDKIEQVETELQSLNRDYAVVQDRHQQMLQQWENLQAKKRLDPLTDQVKFQLIDPPFAEAQPVGPNRTLMLWAVLVVAAGAAIAAAFVANQLRPSFFTRAGLGKAIDLPVLGSISLIQTADQKAKRRAQHLVWSLGCAGLLVATLAVMSVSGTAYRALQGVLAGVGA